MKNILTFSILMTILFLSCKKDEEVVVPDFNQVNTSCVLTSTTDDLSSNVFKFGYDAAGKPTSISFGTTVIPIIYDQLNRLSTISYPLSKVTYKYKDNTFLPSEYIYRATTGKDTSHIQFEYNAVGQLVKQTNFAKTTLGTSTAVYTIVFDANGDITTIKLTGEPTPIFQGISYDTKTNPFATNHWLKYILINVGAEPFDQLFHSKHNCTSWKWNDITSGELHTIKATHTYDAKGYSTQNTSVSTVDGTESFVRVEDNVFNCK